MLPHELSFDVYRGDSFSQRLRFVVDGLPEDLTDKPILAQVRTSTDLTAKLVCTFSVARQDALGIIDIALSPNDTAKLKAGDYAYDIQVGDRTRIAGTITLVPDVSRGA